MSSLMLQGNFAYQDQYSRALSAAYKWHYRITDPDWALEQDVDTWRKIWRDPQLAQAMQIRLHMVAGREWQVVPGNKNPTEQDKFAAEIVADALGHLKKFGEARALLASPNFLRWPRLYSTVRRGRSWRASGLPRCSTARRATGGCHRSFVI